MELFVLIFALHSAYYVPKGGVLLVVQDGLLVFRRGLFFPKIKFLVHFNSFLNLDFLEHWILFYNLKYFAI